uniref:Gustatory receptor n=1 Tax=Anopheles culicifacies TaxID=139723 RepID=A0A182LZZ9_9DIPT
MVLLNECHACFRDAKFFNPTGTNASFRGARIALAIFLVHHINYEVNQYTYVILYDEKWPEFTFYVVYYFIEMITVMIALYYDAVIDVLRIGVRLDCALLSKCLEQNVKSTSGKLDDCYWWRTIEHFYCRMLLAHLRRRDYSRAFRLQLVTIALNTFIVSFSIFYVNMNSIVSYAHEGWMEKYKRVTESLGFFSHLGAILLICHHASELECEMIAAIVTYLVVLLQFRGLEPS